MTETNISEHLEETLKKRMEVLNESAEILVSMVTGSKKEGRVSPIDLRTGLSCYRQLVEVSTLLRFYNEHFYDERAKELQTEIDPALEATEKVLGETIDTLVNKANTER